MELCVLVLALLSCGLAKDTRVGSPEYIGLKPAPINEGQGLKFPPQPSGRQFDPRPQDLNQTVLRARLGSNFDSHVMSIDPPPQLMRKHKDKHHGHGHGHGNGHHGHTTATPHSVESADGAGPGPGPGDFPFRRNKHGRLVPTGQVPGVIRSVNMRYFLLPNGTRVRTNYSAKFRKKLQHFLWAYTACPLEHMWQDLGVRFWPRYVRVGSCGASGASCSIPPGMTCRPDVKGWRTVLIWQCKNKHEHPLPLQCHWMDLHIEIVESCTCACPKSDNAHD